MTYNCRYCDFTWCAGDGDFKQVLLHEKTHRKPSEETNRSLESDEYPASKSHNNTKCPYCGTEDAYFYELKFDNACYCPHCNVNWIEMDNGIIWEIPK